MEDSLYNFTPIPYYCEENIWMLLNSDAITEKDSYAILISNEEKNFIIFEQQSENEHDVVFWDYHVIALERNGLKSKIWDFNTKLDIPCSANTWLGASFQNGIMPEEYCSSFRVVPREVFLRSFVSDRSHMLNPDGSYMKTPPPWDRIGKGRPNLLQYLDMEDESLGTVYGFNQLKQFINALKAP